MDKTIRHECVTVCGVSSVHFDIKLKCKMLTIRVGLPWIVPAVI